MRTPALPRHVQIMMRHRVVIQRCESAAALIAPYCPPAEIERYIDACAAADRAWKARDNVLMLISVLVAPSLVIAVGGSCGVIAGLIFFVMWVGYGAQKCAVENIARAAGQMMLACERLTNSAARGTS